MKKNRTQPYSSSDPAPRGSREVSKISSRQARTIKGPEINIDHVAKLANLTLSPAEKQIFEKQLLEVLDYINKLNEVDTKNVEPIGQITGLENVTREDIAAPSLSQDDALKNAPRTQNGFFEVDAVLAENSPE